MNTATTSASVDPLIEKHGRMVFNTCLRLLGNTTAAEQASRTVFRLYRQNLNKGIKGLRPEALVLYDLAILASKGNFQPFSSPEACPFGNIAGT